MDTKKLTLERESIKLNKKYFTKGEVFLYLGKEYYLDIINNSKSNIYISNNNLIIESPNYNNNNLIKNELRIWYMKQATKRIELIHKYYETFNELKV